MRRTKFRRPRVRSAAEVIFATLRLRHGARWKTKRASMSIYTVHEPPSTQQSAPDPERLVFVRDGFSFWAFLLTPAWMLWHGLWLVFLGYLVVAALLATGLHTIG